MDPSEIDELLGISTKPEPEPEPEPKEDPKEEDNAPSEEKEEKAEEGDVLEEEPEDESVATEADSEGEDQEEDVEVAEEEAEEEEVVDEEKAALQDALKDMQAKIAELEAKLTEKTEGAKEATDIIDKRHDPQPQPFLATDEEFEEVISSREGMNKAFTAFYNSMTEGWQAAVPQIVARVVDERVAIAQATTRFVNENKDLFEDNIPAQADPNDIKMKRWKWIEEKVTSLQAANPQLASKPYELLKMAGKEMRDVIGKAMTPAEKKAKKEVVKKRRPFPTKPGARPAVPKKPEKPGFEDEVQALFELE